MSYYGRISCDEYTIEVDYNPNKLPGWHVNGIENESAIVDMMSRIICYDERLVPSNGYTEINVIPYKDNMPEDWYELPIILTIYAAHCEDEENNDIELYEPIYGCIALNGDVVDGDTSYETVENMYNDYFGDL